MNKKILLSLAIISIIALPVIAGAWTPPPEPTSITKIDTIIAKIITFVWEFFAGFAVIMMVVAGILFLTANGDPGKITTARNAFIFGTVGILVAIIAFSIVGIVTTAIR